MMPIFLALLAAASAQTEDPFAFATLDRNRDGFVSHAEVEAAIRPMFDAIDKDRSGTITKSEMRSFMMSHMFEKPPAFAKSGPRPKLDFDKNGQMTFAAFAASFWQANFAPLDTDHDDRISRAEYDRAKR